MLAAASADPHLADAGMAGGNLVEQLGAGHGVLDAGRGDQRRQEEADSVGHDAPPAAHDLLTHIRAWLAAGRLMEVFMLCASITQADGSAFRPCFLRTNSLSRPLSWTALPPSATAQ
ncbi:hypothetical protein ACFYZB_20510 [Streptomyces sp. NPDC001852]|uniref:hypothetical protein n=1 Tax=Streptomyces sp. NPDC001852 TaxID=3364619 RepID=UPI0036B67F01